MSDKQLTLRTDIKEILAHQPALQYAGETVTFDEAYGPAWVRLYRESYATQFVFSQEEGEAEWQYTLQGEYGVVWKAASPQFFVQEKLVGSVITVVDAPWEDTPSGPFLIEVIVDPAFQQRGIATWLLTKAAAVCCAAGKETLALRVLDSNTPAKQLYAKLGFSLWLGKR